MRKRAGKRFFILNLEKKEFVCDVDSGCEKTYRHLPCTEYRPTQSNFVSLRGLDESTYAFG